MNATSDIHNAIVGLQSIRAPRKFSFQDNFEFYITDGRIGKCESNNVMVTLSVWNNGERRESVILDTLSLSTHKTTKVLADGSKQSQIEVRLAGSKANAEGEVLKSVGAQAYQDLARRSLSSCKIK